jgi:type I restriction enzyme M protein
MPGFCKSATLNDIRGHDCVLTPGRYVGIPDFEDEDEPFEEKMKRLAAQVEKQFSQSAELENVIRDNLRKLGYGA